MESDVESELKRNLERYWKLFARAEASPDYWNAVAAYEFVRELAQRMEEQGISRAELARRLGTSKAYVTKVLSADVNFTLATMNRLAAAVGGMVHFRIVDRKAASGQGSEQKPPEGSEARAPRQAKHEGA
jgi:antitoxin component HigA of HigAB toxin-antitoxin module